MLKTTKKHYNYLIIFFMLCLLLPIQNQVLAHQPKVGEWGTAVAHFEIDKGNIKELKLDNTLLGVLVKESGKKISDYLDEDKETLRSFKITYRVPIKLKKGSHAKEEEIVQYGLFKALPVAMQEKLEDTQVQTVTVQYKVNDPLLIAFVVKDETFSAPALLTDKVSLFKKHK